MPLHLHFHDTGPNERHAIVMIHGFPLTSESFSHQFNALSSAGFRVIAFDRRGFGQSEKPEFGFDYDTLASDVHDLLLRMELDEVTLLGFSMGGGEVARYIANFGEDRV